jgi:trans-aconitate methyltransferase
MRYEVVSHDAVLAALNSELITAYVEAVMVPSNPDRNTFDMMADNDSEFPLQWFLGDVLTDLDPKKSFGWCPKSVRRVQQRSLLVQDRQG